MVHTWTLKHWSLQHTAQSSEPSHNRLLHMSRPPCLLHHGDSRLAPLAVHLTEDETPRPTVELGEAPKALLDDRQQRLPVLYPRAAGLLRVKRSKRRGDVGEGRASRLVGRSVGRGAIWLPRGRLGEGQHGDALERRAHLEKGEELHDAPEPAAVRRPREDEQPVAARQEDGQARERLLHVSLVDAELVEPDGGQPAVLLLERLGPRAQCGPLWPGRVAPRVRDEGVALAHGSRLAAPLAAVRVSRLANTTAVAAALRGEEAAPAGRGPPLARRARVALGDKVVLRQLVEADGAEVRLGPLQQRVHRARHRAAPPRDESGQHRRLPLLGGGAGLAEGGEGGGSHLRLEKAGVR
mmetsp:Transcript_17646/g.57945  ORF Transcript_17646/g.57945 Transcript_17646/m.57945 type:complete len:353 (+) Transcript_17646:115-1173(+)